MPSKYQPTIQLTHSMNKHKHSHEIDFRLSRRTSLVLGATLFFLVCTLFCFALGIFADLAHRRKREREREKQANCSIKRNTIETNIRYIVSH